MLRTGRDEFGDVGSGEVRSATGHDATDRPWPADGVVTLEDVAAVAADPRPGHVPGARSMPTADNLAPDGRFLSSDALADRYRGHADPVRGRAGAPGVAAGVGSARARPLRRVR